MTDIETYIQSHAKTQKKPVEEAAKDKIVKLVAESYKTGTKEDKR